VDRVVSNGGSKSKAGLAYLPASERKLGATKLRMQFEN